VYRPGYVINLVIVNLLDLSKYRTFHFDESLVHAVTCVLELAYFGGSFEYFSQCWHETAKFIHVMQGYLFTFELVGKLDNSSQLAV